MIILLLLGDESIHVFQVFLVYCVVKTFISLLIICHIVLFIIKSGVLMSPMITVACAFILSVLLVFVPTFKGSLFRCLYVYNGCKLLMD